MSKTIICHGNENDYYYGRGATLKEAYKDYRGNDGEDSFDECRFFEAEEIEIELIIKQKKPKNFPDKNK